MSNPDRPSSMRAARFPGGARVTIEEREVPAPASGEYLVHVGACALCGTDRTGFNDGSPVVPGHEIAGTVVDCGTGCDPSARGRNGVVYLVSFCGSCAACKVGATNMCLDRRGMYGLTLPGGFAEYVAVRADCFLPIDASLSLPTATALLDLLGTTRHALLRSGPPPRTLAVLGCGPIGLGAIAVATTLGVKRIYAADVSGYRASLATKLGALTVDAGAVDTAEEMRRLEPDGCDVVVEAAGLSVTQRQAMAVAAPGGRVMIVAHSRGGLELQTSRDLIQREISLVGSEYFPIAEFEGTHALVVSGNLDPSPILTHDFALDDLQEACDAFFGGETGKVVVHP